MSLVFGLICKVFLDERFPPEQARNWTRRWIRSEKHPPGKPFGRWQGGTAGQYFADPLAQAGIITLDNNRHYCISRRFDTCWTNKSSPLVVQYTIKQDRPTICGGFYIKLLPDGLDQKRFTGSTPYSIMFGPDNCYAHTHHVKLLFSRNGTNYNMNKMLEPILDGLTHMYTLSLNGNSTFSIYIDGHFTYSAEFRDEFDYEGPKWIMDPYDHKPTDWDDREWVIDQNDRRPEGWDDRKLIPDLKAKKPELWNDERDGVWSPPMIPNPEYNGTWHPREIPNDNYMGIWRPRKIPNPDYSPDPDFGHFDDLCYLGIDVLQDNAGTLFDNFLVTDNLTYAEEVARDVFHPYRRKEAEEYERWGGKSRWEDQRDWGIMDFGKSKKFGEDENGNKFEDPNAFYQNTKKKKIGGGSNNQKQMIDGGKGFHERDDL